jgi:hypothetical protein
LKDLAQHFAQVQLGGYRSADCQQVFTLPDTVIDEHASFAVAGKNW